MTFCSKETVELPSVKVFENAISVSYTKANVSAEVIDQGGAEVKSRGFVYGKSGGTMDTVYSGMGLGVYSAELNNLQPNTSYVYQAFARNAGGVAVSGLVNFVTKDQDTPVVKTLEVDEITAVAAVCSGKVTDDNGAEVTARGVCWSTNHSPTVDDAHSESGSGLGEFTCELSGLVGSTTYYVRAYAVNSRGTGYGEELEFVTQDYDLPQLTTANVSGVTETTATCGGEVTAAGGGTIIDRGICWSTSHNPTVDDTHLSAGEGLGAFTCEMTDLNVHTKYYVRAYAVNEKGAAYGSEKNFTTSSVPPTVATVGVSDVAPTSAKGSGNVTDDGGSTVTERGICWSTSHNPTLAGSHVAAGEGTGSFTATMSNLTDHTTYYMRAYAVNGVGTVYGEEVEFETPPIYAPVVNTSSMTSVGQFAAVAGGNVTDDGGANVTERGICWGTSHNPTTSGSHLVSGTGTGSFTVNITGLSPSTSYYVRAYAINIKGTSYGEEVSFETDCLHLATITTASVTNVTYNSATCGGDVSSDGGAAVTKRGICWSRNQNPTLDDDHSNDGTGTGSFTSQMTGLAHGVTYYVRAYATNSVGTNYGEQKTFTTPDVVPPTVTTNEVHNIAQTSAKCGGNVTDAGGGLITARGVCWSTSQNPTLNNSHSTNGTGTGNFNSEMTGLNALTTYYVRAYATNEAGTSYGEQKTFTTAPAGSIIGMYSVSAGQRVYFSQGNLQYQASTHTWRFAEHQYDCIGNANGNVSSSYDGWIDLFGWGTSGWNCGNTYYRPWDSDNSDGSLYGPSGNNSLVDSYANSDWGHYNAISNGGNQSGLWRALTREEWAYVLTTRNTESGIRYAKANVDGVNGVILVPDDWNDSYYSLNSVNQGNASYSENTISSYGWYVMESHGAVFLPASGWRHGSSVSNVNGYGNYWSVTYRNASNAYYLYFDEAGLYTINSSNRCNGQSVRLVCPAR